MSSLYASGVSRKVRTPQPRRARRYAPKETRSQRGSYKLRTPISHCAFLTAASLPRKGAARVFGSRGEAYVGNDLVLDNRRQGDEFEEDNEVELDTRGGWSAIWFSWFACDS